ncbi:DUF2829 domain-containing protein [Aliarcobacter butzleri]|uniref:DUF2829 domain-containing protein n=1 Tax=Aliarcobacter butzleri TaxID=28197 RepID=UPI001EDC4434|nr:DUF2829 domain-containing protein [Aliarcobacter butzleri]MCG3710261.1 DUF2829 domain-containing protein [Aliarcobacter butzleri]MCG3714023.1 DUF2829 domain-containing protein [Aliarcobacter butzleri]
MKNRVLKTDYESALLNYKRSRFDKHNKKVEYYAEQYTKPSIRNFFNIFGALTKDKARKKILKKIKDYNNGIDSFDSLFDIFFNFQCVEEKVDLTYYAPPYKYIDNKLWALNYIKDDYVFLDIEEIEFISKYNKENNIPDENCSFEYAISILKSSDNVIIRRKKFQNYTYQFMFVCRNDENFFINSDGSQTMYYPSGEDMFANDWIIDYKKENI